MTDTQKSDQEGVGLVCHNGVTHHDVCPCRKELEAERDRLAADLKTMKENWFTSNRNLHEAWAERDKLREALEKIAQYKFNDPEIVARKALSKTGK